MIYCSDRKIGIFFNTKTGTHSVMSAFRKYIPPVTYHERIMSNFDLIKEYKMDLPEDFDTYKFYVFYREPVDRFIDAFKTYKRLGYAAMYLRFFPREDFRALQREIEKARFDNYIVTKRDPKQQYHWLSQETRDKIESISVSRFFEEYGDDIINIKRHDRLLHDFSKSARQEVENASEEAKQSVEEIIEKHRKFREETLQPWERIDFTVPAMFVPQKFWLDHSQIDITYLNFHNFDSEMRRLAALFDVTLETVPHKNPPTEIPNDPPLTEEEIALVKLHYQQDYDFFASKGITFG